MNHLRIAFCTLSASLLLSFCQPDATGSKVNIQNDRISTTSPLLCDRIPCPSGYSRLRPASGSFSFWLQHVTLKQPGTPVYLFNHELKARQDVHEAVLTIDTGDKDLQQCADAVMRLRAEYLFQQHLYDSIRFTFTSGSVAAYARWRSGYRPQINGSDVRWTKTAQADTSYRVFRQYLNTVFMYCGTYSLSRELQSVPVADMRPGDVFIYGGFPGHAMMVMDVAVQAQSGKKIFLLAQSYMPAQDIHLVKNFNNDALGPWYAIPENGILQTPEWTFETGDLKRFR